MFQNLLIFTIFHAASGIEPGTHGRSRWNFDQAVHRTMLDGGGLTASWSHGRPAACGRFQLSFTSALAAFILRIHPCNAVPLLELHPALLGPASDELT